MHLITPYAPPSFLKPVVIVSTLVTSLYNETSIKFVEAFHVWHALDVANCHDRNCRDTMAPDSIHSVRSGEWIIIQKHETSGGALEFHLNLTKDFINGGSEAEWQQGWESYLDLWNRFAREDR